MAIWYFWLEINTWQDGYYIETGPWVSFPHPGIILWMRPANERQRYIVMSSPIGWAHTQNDPCSPPFPVAKNIWITLVLDTKNIS